MKAFILSMALAASAFAANTKPFLTKSSGGGFTMPEYAGGERCELYADKVVVSHQFGMVQPTALRVIEEKKVNLIGNIRLVIEKAASEEVTTKPNGLCDGPSTSITADNGQQEPVLLYVTGGCGSPARERNGVYSSKLREIIDLYCPKTF